MVVTFHSLSQECKLFVLAFFFCLLNWFFFLNRHAPKVHPLPEENRVIQGQDFSITCEASGTPQPTIKWTKVHEALGDNVHQMGNVLRITNARPENRGVFLCIAENAGGHDQSSTVIDIERKLSLWPLFV